MTPAGGTVSTSDLAVWFGVTRKTVLKHLQQAGVEPTGRGPAGVALWPRKKALSALYGRVATDSEAGRLH